MSTKLGPGCANRWRHKLRKSSSNNLVAPNMNLFATTAMTALAEHLATEI